MARKKSRNSNQNNTQVSKRGSNQYRIIGGQWRGRKLPFVDTIGLRPTPDRIRETLFNWLQSDIHNAYCLDMFAGSGALSFEALSRGANNVVMVEKDKKCVNQLTTNLALVNDENANNNIEEAQILHGNALAFVPLLFNNAKKSKKMFDIVFLDPPYRQGLIEKSLEYLQNEILIDENSLIYAEHESEENINWDQFGLEVIKQAKAGQVQSYLLQKSL